MKSSRPTAIDLFCGAGGMSLGFEQAGFNVIAAFDKDPIHVEVHSKNFPECKTLEADLSEETGDSLRNLAGLGERKIDVVFGGPPCGGFSIMGNRDPDDARNNLLMHFARLVSELRPRYFVVENVQGLNSGPMISYLKDFDSYISETGYSIVKPIMILDASDFGVPQKRKRLFILGHMTGLKQPRYPKPSNNGFSKSPSVWDAIGDLEVIYEKEYLFSDDKLKEELYPPVSHYAEVMRGETNDPHDRSIPRKVNNNYLTGCGRVKHSTEVIERFNQTNPGEREKISKYYRLKKIGKSNTLRAGTGNNRGSYSAARPIHPNQPSCITVREGARLQSFPDWFTFHETKWHGFRQVGNSVPPLLARAIAKRIYKIIKDIKHVQSER